MLNTFSVHNYYIINYKLTNTIIIISTNYNIIYSRNQTICKKNYLVRTLF